MRRTSATSSDELWTRFRATRAPAVRDQLVLQHAPIVKFVVARIASACPDHLDREDLIGSGIFGLIQAIEHFDPERGVQFHTFAVPRIRGAVLDAMRMSDWAPRSVRAKARELELVRSRLEHELKRSPSRVELADALGVSPEQVDRLHQQVDATTVVTLETGGRDDAWSAHEVVDPDGDPATRIAVDGLAGELDGVIRELPDRERRVVELYYFEQMTLAQIGATLGVSESRICQLHGRAVKRMRSQLVGSTPSS